MLLHPKTAYLKSALLVAVYIAVIFISPVWVAKAQDTQIVAEVCDSQSPQLTVSAPLADSIVSSRNLEITASTLRTSQVDIYLNNTYSNSVAVDQSQLLSAEVTLFDGANSIRLEAYYSCNQSNSSLVFAVTYDPSATEGPTTTNTTEPGSTGPEVITNPVQSQVLDNGNQGILENSIFEPLAHWLGIGNSSASPARPVVAAGVLTVTTGLAIDFSFFGMGFSRGLLVFARRLLGGV